MADPGVWIVAEATAGQLRPISLELLAAARPIADALGQPLGAALLGHGVHELARPLIAHGADHVVVADHEALAAYRTDPYLEVLTAILRDDPSGVLLMGHTSMGKDLAGRLSVRLDTSLTPDCVELALEGAHVRKVRLALGGVMRVASTANRPPQVATLRPGAFEPLAARSDRPGEIVAFEVPELPRPRTEVLHTSPGVALSEARVVVTGGMGVGPDHWGPLEQLAAALGGVVGATRSVVQAGWRPSTEQVGQAGHVVAPRLYVAVGASGSADHLDGMRTSRTIIAIDSRPDTPMMRLADLAVVGDFQRVLPQLVLELRAPRR